MTSFKSLKWYLEVVNCNKELFEFSQGDNIRIGLIDSGIDKNHCAFNKNINMINAQSFVSNDLNIKDYIGHGTQIAGIITEISPKCTITPYKVVSENAADSKNIISAIIKAAKNKEHIINISMGTYKNLHNSDDYKDILMYRKAIEYATRNGVIVVSSIGNKSLDLDYEYKRSGLLHIPSSLDNVLGVTSINRNNYLSSFSNYTNKSIFVAPGGDFIFKNGNLDIENLLLTAHPTYLNNNQSDLGIPQGYIATAGGSIATAITSGLISIFLSFYFEKFESIPTPDYVISQIKKYTCNDTEDTQIENKIPNISDLIKSYF